MNKEQKAAAVEAIADQLQAAGAVFAVDYRGISVPQAADLRARLRDADATFRIVKNSLTERAADRAGAESLRALLDGPTALTFVRGDAALAAKALADFARAESVLEFKGGLMDGEEVSADEIRSIARLPARDVLYAQMVGTVAAPLTGLVRGLNGLLSGLAIQLGQIVERGLLGQGEAQPEAEVPAGPEAEPDAQTEPEPEPEAQAEAADEEAEAAPPADADDQPAPASEEEASDGDGEDETEQADASAAAESDDAAEAKEEA